MKSVRILIAHPWKAYAGSGSSLRRELLILLASTCIATQARANDETPYFRAENSSVESDTEGVEKEEKIATSSITSTEPSKPRGSSEALQKGEVMAAPHCHHILQNSSTLLPK